MKGLLQSHGIVQNVTKLLIIIITLYSCKRLVIHNQQTVVYRFPVPPTCRNNIALLGKKKTQTKPNHNTTFSPVQICVPNNESESHLVKFCISLEMSPLDGLICGNNIRNIICCMLSDELLGANGSRNLFWLPVTPEV